jgi:hypothetical protein
VTEPSKELLTEETKWAWFDEDGEQVSPTHQKFVSALKFFDGWQARFDRVSWSDTARQQLTRTGKPPVALRRLIVRTYAAPLTAAQQEIVNTYAQETSGTQE